MKSFCIHQIEFDSNKKMYFNRVENIVGVKFLLTAISLFPFPLPHPAPTKFQKPNDKDGA